MERFVKILLSVFERISGVAVALVGGGVLGVAAWLTPEKAGHGTHMQLGLPRCGWVSLFDKPCPTCGMTTAFGHAAEGNFVNAAVSQPMGALLSVLAASMVWGGLHAAITGARIGDLALKLVNRWTVFGGFVLLGGAWAYKLLTWGGG